MKKFFIIIIIITTYIFAMHNVKDSNILWIDGPANCARFDSRNKINSVLDKAVKAKFDIIILDLKIFSGEVLYPSSYASQLADWRGDSIDTTLNYAKIFIEEAHNRDLKIEASINVFSEGYKGRGLVYTKHPEWQTYLNTPKGIMPTTEYDKSKTAFTNPILPEVQKHELNIIKEIIEKFNFDGIVLDRARYNNIKSDFSSYSKRKFEEFIDTTIVNWPEDIYSWEKNNGDWQIIEGPYYKKWLYWRSKNIHDFFAKAQKLVKTTNPNINFATYVGAWYPSYYKVGVNWASPEYDPSQEYDWALPEYKKTGYADHLDYLMTGSYFYRVNIEEAIQANKEKSKNEKKIKKYHTVEGSAKISNKVTKNELPVYGSLYTWQYKNKKDPQQFVKAIQMIQDVNDGIMIFDVSHLEDYGWWKYLEANLK